MLPPLWSKAARNPAAEAAFAIIASNTMVYYLFSILRFLCLCGLLFLASASLLTARDPRMFGFAFYENRFARMACRETYILYCTSEDTYFHPPPTMEAAKNEAERRQQQASTLPHSYLLLLVDCPRLIATSSYSYQFSRPPQQDYLPALVLLACFQVKSCPAV